MDDSFGERGDARLDDAEFGEFNPPVNPPDIVAALMALNPSIGDAPSTNPDPYLSTDFMTLELRAGTGATATATAASNTAASSNTGSRGAAELAKESAMERFRDKEAVRRLTPTLGDSLIGDFFGLPEVDSCTLAGISRLRVNGLLVEEPGTVDTDNAR